MNEIWAVFKAILDPLFIIYVLLLVSFFIFYKNIKKKSESLILLLCLILLYGVSIAPVSNYLCYHLEKDYIHLKSTGLMKGWDALVILGNGTKEIKSIQETFSSDFGTLRVVHAATVYHKTRAILSVPARGRGMSPKLRPWRNWPRIWGCRKIK